MISTTVIGRARPARRRRRVLVVSAAMRGDINWNVTGDSALAGLQAALVRRLPDRWPGADEQPCHE